MIHADYTIISFQIKCEVLTSWEVYKQYFHSWAHILWERVWRGGGIYKYGHFWVGGICINSDISSCAALSIQFTHWTQKSYVSIRYIVAHVRLITVISDMGSSFFFFKTQHCKEGMKWVFLFYFFFPNTDVTGL